MLFGRWHFAYLIRLGVQYCECFVYTSLAARHKDLVYMIVNCTIEMADTTLSANLHTVPHSLTQSYRINRAIILLCRTTLSQKKKKVFMHTCRKVMQRL